MALQALNLKIFHGIDLKQIKDTLTTMLSHIRDNGMFLEYTQHDISHVDGMLHMLDYIIPDHVAKKVMTPTDWLMLTLSIYFHDLGMLITQEEYATRMSNQNYCDYLTTVDRTPFENINPDRVERNLYQNFVREHHGDRIYDWICASDKIPKNNNSIDKLLYDLLHQFDENFRRDLACICRSHQEDLSNRLDEYKIQRPYEQNAKSEVNLLYIAVLLRTADLLHVNSERAPLTDYLVISPKDPYSHREWVQQSSVQQIRPKKEVDRDNIVDPTIEQHRFEVIASFKDEDAYSHFMDYLRDAEQELKTCYELCKESMHKNKNEYNFPWDAIDRSRIETIGFNAKKLMFEIDKENILKLLIGHTLYSHANVVLRELAQNAIDACRLMQDEQKRKKSYHPKVLIQWNSTDRILTVSDNGTGMNEHIILNYLLKVGSSRYQSKEFHEQHASFHSISRFGIGLLTCFMISDEIEITTRWFEETLAHRLKIRSVDGEYILRNDLPSDDILDQAHGSTFKLKVRDDAEFDDIEEDLRNWIIVPRCDISLIVDNKPEISIGATSEKDVLKKYLEDQNINVESGPYKLETKEQEGMTIHYLLHQDELFNTWSLATTSGLNDTDISPIGICIEGIKVSNRTPGFDIRNYIVLVNCTGKDAPTTNVARDSLEQTEEQDKLLRFVYNTYLEIIQKQIDTLRQNYSLSWAVDKAAFAIDSMIGLRHEEDIPFRSKKLFDECLSTFDCFLIDNGNELHLTSLAKLPQKIWTIESTAFSSAVRLVQEIRNCKKTAFGITQELSDESDKQIQHVYSMNSSTTHRTTDLFLKRYEISKIRIDKNSREIRFCWTPTQNQWIVLSLVRPSRRLYYESRLSNFYIMRKNSNIELQEGQDEQIVISQYGYFLLAGNPLCDYMEELASSQKEGDRFAANIVCGFILNIVHRNKGYDEEYFDKYFQNDENFMGKDLWKYVDENKLKNIFEILNLRKIDFYKFYTQPE